MVCDEVREQLAEHLLGTLPDADDAAVRRHLRGCAACRQERAALEEGMSTFARAAHQVEPPESLRERVLAALAEERDEAPKPRRRVPSLALVGRAAAVVALAGAIAWGAVATERASRWQAEAEKYESFLGALGGKEVRVGTIEPTGRQAMEGSFVLYDSEVGQSWALVLVRAPGVKGEVRTFITSSKRRIELFPLRFDAAGEASTWLVTGTDISSFTRVRLIDQSGHVVATGTIERE